MTEDNFKKQSHPGFLLGVVVILSGAILFSVKAVLIKKVYALDEADAVSLLTLRMVFSLPFYIFFLFTQKPNEKIEPFNWMVMIGLGLVGYYLSSILDFSGLLYISASLERIILFTYPSFVLLINWLVFRQELSYIGVFALFLTYMGVALSFSFENLEAKNLFLGGGMVLMASVTYASYLVGTNRLVCKFGTLLFTSLTMTIATFGICSHYVLTHPISAIFKFSTKTYVYSVAMAVFCTVLPSFLISEGIKRIGSTNSSIVASVGPISTILLAAIFLGESIHLFQLLGGLLVVIGVTLIALFGKDSENHTQKTGSHGSK